MLRRRTIAITVVSAVAALSAAGASAAGLNPTEVTIKGENGDYYGAVKSTKDCRPDRTVTVYKMAGSKPKPSADKRIGSDTTDNKGKWSIGNSGYKHGKFYARVPKREFAKASARDAGDCAGATSAVLKQ